MLANRAGPLQKNQFFLLFMEPLLEIEKKQIVYFIRSQSSIMPSLSVFFPLQEEKRNGLSSSKN